MDAVPALGRLLVQRHHAAAEAALRKDLVFAEDERSRMNLPTVLELFMGVRLNNFRLFNHYAYFHLWSNLYSQVMVIFPFLLMGPSLFTGLITLGVIQQVSNAFNTPETGEHSRTAHRSRLKTALRLAAALQYAALTE